MTQLNETQFESAAKISNATSTTFPNRGDEEIAGDNSAAPTRVTPSLLTSARLVKHEANLLRFPFFSLARKGLRNKSGLVVHGTTTIDQSTCDFEYRITCNTDDPYPGPLARKVHVGLLSLMQSRQAFPFANPIEFTWGELFRAIGCTASGTMERKVKQAIRSIEGTRIRSRYALKNSEGRPMKSRERGFGLYEQYVFFDELLPDSQTLADKNFVWLADWYLSNLNSLYCTPLDYGLWRTLEDESPIASRLYEFYTFNFTGPWETFTIDYDKLCRFLPVAPCRHPSQARQQFTAALKSLGTRGVLATSEWTAGKRGQLQLAARRGEVLTRPKQSRRQPAEPPVETTDIQELRRQRTPEDELVAQFNALMFDDNAYLPTSCDHERARAVIKEYGAELAQRLLPAVVELVSQRFPAAKSFGASSRYWQEAAVQHAKVEKQKERRRDELIQEEVERAKRKDHATESVEWQMVWDALPEARQQAIRQQVLASQPVSLTKFPKTLQRLCLLELARQESR